ncbi:hypothetical protein Pmani_022776 [Petrolisthes manimaculis]|uniref:Uncharacterized protein n=1 Tax=Petrolisthes manimaculis TaxID=1843537 RepID=A0AAE1PBC3_9EUCA|nr:hypothetical protein Pmani_022776 [Petrolisthes manimaculis]
MLHTADTHKNGFVPGGTKADSAGPRDAVHQGELQPLNTLAGSDADPQNDTTEVRVTIHENPLVEAGDSWGSSGPQLQQEDPQRQQQQHQQLQQLQQQTLESHVSQRGGGRRRWDRHHLGLILLLGLACLGLILLLLVRLQMSGMSHSYYCILPSHHISPFSQSDTSQHYQSVCPTVPDLTSQSRCQVGHTHIIVPLPPHHTFLPHLPTFKAVSPIHYQSVSHLHPHLTSQCHTSIPTLPVSANPPHFTSQLVPYLPTIQVSATPTHLVSQCHTYPPTFLVCQHHPCMAPSRVNTTRVTVPVLL